jgi:hypothetical protein
VAEYPLNETTQIKLDGSGNGTAKLGPTAHGDEWDVSEISVKANANPTNEATCNIYNGHSPTDDNFVDGTFSGSSGDSSDRTGPPLRLGSYIWAVWNGGDSGQTATLSVTGTRKV